MKSQLEKNGIEIYSTHNEEKSVLVERLIRTIKNKIYKYMTSVSKNVYTDQLDDIVNKYYTHTHNTHTHTHTHTYIYIITQIYYYINIFIL